MKVLSSYGTKITTELAIKGDYISRVFTQTNARFKRNVNDNKQLYHLGNFVNDNIGLDHQTKTTRIEMFDDNNNNNNDDDDDDDEEENEEEEYHIHLNQNINQKR